MYKSIFVLFNLLIFSNLLSKENWSHVLEADSELFKSKFDLYIDVNSIVKEENLIYFTEKHVPKKIANVNGMNVGALKTKFIGDCDKITGKPVQIDVFSDFESTKLLESQKGNPNAKMEPFGNPELRLKKYCKYALNENKSITTKRQTSNPQVRVPAHKQQVVRNDSTNFSDELHAAYLMYLNIKACNKLSPIYVDRGQVESLQKKLKSIEKNFKERDTNLNPDEIWNNASKEFLKDMQPTYELMEISDSYSGEINSACKIYLLSIKSLDQYLPSKTTIEKDF